MSYKYIALSDLHVNRANDRHGELENETTAISWLFNNHESQMKKLARDILASGGIYEPPLVFPISGKYIVYDGNRRTTCLKLLDNPKKAPSVELQEYFKSLRAKWESNFPTKIQCRVETDRDQIDEILYRRHTGSQGGVGQTTWDGKMKTTFIDRTGKGTSFNLADNIENLLKEEDRLPFGNKKIPRTNLNRLLSAEAFRNRVGITTAKGRLDFTRKKEVVVNALARIADDLAHKRKTLDDVWDVDKKSKYLDALELEGVLPAATDVLDDHSSESSGKKLKPKPNTPSKIGVSKQKRTTLIPNMDYGVAWAGRLQRHRAIWEELQFKLELADHPNAIAVLCRVLLEISADNYVKRSGLTTVAEKDALAKKLVGCAEDMFSKNKIDDRYVQVIRKSRNMDAIISVDTLNKYVHSSHLVPASDHLTAIWDTYSNLIVHCLNE